MINLAFLNVRTDIDNAERDLVGAGAYDIKVVNGPPVNSPLGTSVETVLTWHVPHVELPLYAALVTMIEAEDMLSAEEQVLPLMQSRLQATFICLLKNALDMTRDYAATIADEAEE